MKRDGEKARLRREVLSARDGMTTAGRDLASSRITSELLSLAGYGSSRTILGYCSFGSEPDTRGFLSKSLRSGKSLVIPKIEKSSGRLSLHEVSNLTADLAPGVWGIMEPEDGLPEVRIEDVDFILIPGVAFDRKGGRLGYGGGYYDRMLAGSTKRTLLVAAAFEVQVVAEIPVEEHDVRVDVILTENEVIRCETGAQDHR